MGGRRLLVRVWGPAGRLVAPGSRGPARAGGWPSVVLVHGFGEHSGRYEELGQELAAAGWTLWSMDLPGHGRSQGPRADIEKLEWALADIGQLVAEAAGEAPGAPVVLMGHSMGGALAAAYAVRRPGQLAGLVLSAPALHLAWKPRALALAVGALARLAPGAGVARVAPRALSRDNVAVQRFVEDPLVWHGRVPARCALEMYRAARAAVAGANGLSLPLLVLHGTDDRVVPVGASRRYFARVGSGDKELRTFEGYRHEVLQELGRRQVVVCLLSWLARHWPQAAPPPSAAGRAAPNC